MFLWRTDKKLSLNYYQILIDLLCFSYKDASVELIDTALALAQAYASTGREEAEST